MASPSFLPGSAAPFPPPATRAPTLSAPIKPFPTSATRPSAASAPRSSALFAPALSDSAAPSLAACGSFRPSVPASPAPHQTVPAAPSSALPASVLRPSTASVTALRALRPPHDWGAVVAPPPLAPPSVSVMGASLALVSLPTGGGWSAQ